MIARRARVAACAVALATVTTPARAEDPPADAPALPAPPKPKRAVYSLPWGLRPAIPPTVVRSDTAFAFQGKGSTTASTVLAGVKILDDVGLYARGALVHHAPGGSNKVNDERVVASNPLLFGIWAPKLTPSLRLPLFAGVAFPIGTGSGNDGSRPAYAANGAGLSARSGMDNALFAVNYLTPAFGAGLAYVANGVTLQGEVTVLELLRAAGDRFDSDTARTNTTFAAHAGYLIVDWLTISAELRHQRFVSTPAAVERDPARRDQTTVLAGARVNVFAGGLLLRPGLAYAHPLDDPMAAADYRVVHLDVPVLF